MSAHQTKNELVELESIFDTVAKPVVMNSVVPRWKRKALTNTSNTPSKKTASVAGKKEDRFIPNRSAMDMENANLYDHSNADNVAPETGDSNTYREQLEGSLGIKSEEPKVLAFKNKAPVAKDDFHNEQRVLYSCNKIGQGVMNHGKAKPSRHIPSVPVRILDAPDLVDDYYLNLLSWGGNNNLAIALGQTVYLWNAGSGNIEELMTCQDDDDFVTSVSWIKGSSSDHIAIGTNSAEVQLWDASRMKQVRGMGGHQARVGALAWNNFILSSGSRDSTIIQHDVRIQNHCTATLRGHTQEVCGLSWSPDGSMLASGGNDNKLCLWDAALSAGVGSTSTFATTPTFTCTQHQAAVKALAWCPWERNLLATGGGTADRCIKFWNTKTGACLNSIDTGSQVCSLLWSPTEKEILSSHGFSQNQLCLWRYPSMSKVKELTGHTARVLHMAMSPDGTQVVSAAADETLRFWDIFSAAKSKKDVHVLGSGGSSLKSAMNIR